MIVAPLLAVPVAEMPRPVALSATTLGNTLQSYIAAPGFAPVAIMIAFAAGAMHALAPGHGKSLAAAYLVGSRGRVRDAAWLGGSVALMHTLSCLALAVAWTFFNLSGLVKLQALTTWLELAAGLLVVGTGLWLLHRHLRASHSHDHRHDHDHGHNHSHGPAPSRPGLVLLGISGGLTPSPAAFLVLAAGLFSGRAVLALLLVACFGLGLAGVVFTVGLLAVSGRNVVMHASKSRTVLQLANRIAPVLAACGITALGCGIASIAALHLT